MWKKLESAKQIKNVMLGSSIRIDGVVGVLTRHYADDDFGFDYLLEGSEEDEIFANGETESDYRRIEYWDENTYEIPQSKVSWVKRLRKMEFDDDARYIFPANSIAQAKMINEACECAFGSSIPEDQLISVGFGIVRDLSGIIQYNPAPDCPAIVMVSDTFIIQYHPSYSREVVEVLGKKFYRDELEAHLEKLEPAQ